MLGEALPQTVTVPLPSSGVALVVCVTVAEEDMLYELLGLALVQGVAVREAEAGALPVAPPLPVVMAETVAVGL